MAIEETQLRDELKKDLKDLGFLKDGQEGRVDKLPLVMCEELRDEIDQLLLLKKKRSRLEGIESIGVIDPAIANIQSTTEEHMKILLLPDKSAARSFFMHKRFSELTDNVKLPENKMLEPFDFTTEELPPVIQGLKDRYKELKSIRETSGEDGYFLSIAEEYATQEEMDYIKFFEELKMQKQCIENSDITEEIGLQYFATVENFLKKRSQFPFSDHLDKKIDDYMLFLIDPNNLSRNKDEVYTLLNSILLYQNQIKELVLSRMYNAFNCSRKLLDYVFEVIGKTSSASEKEHQSSYYKDLEKIQDLFDLFEFCAQHYIHIKRIKKEMSELTEEAPEELRKAKKRELKDHVKAFWEGQRLHALLNEFRLDSLSAERLFAEEFDAYFQEDYMRRVLPYSQEVSVQTLREEYGIPVDDEGVATIYFTISKDEHANDNVKWDWYDSGMSEAISVSPKILIDKETKQEVVCFAYTDIKTPEALVSKKLRKQEITIRDVNRMSIIFVSKKDKVGTTEKDAAYTSIKDPILFVERNIISLAGMEQNLRTTDDGNPYSDKNFQVLKGVLLCRHRNGQRRMELQVYNDIAGYLISQSAEHPAGHVNYDRKRVLNGLTPKVLPKSIYGESFLERVFHRELNEYAMRQIKQHRPDLLVA